MTRYFAEERQLSSGQRGSVTLLRHRESGQRFILRRTQGSAAVYKALLPLRSPYLPQIYAVAELNGCAFMGNGVGLHYNTEWFYWNIGICVNTQFRENELAVDLEQYPGFDTLDFSGSTFYQNGKNILNRPDFSLNLTGVIME